MITTKILKVQFKNDCKSISAPNELETEIPIYFLYDLIISYFYAMNNNSNNNILHSFNCFHSIVTSFCVIIISYC